MIKKLVWQNNDKTSRLENFTKIRFSLYRLISNGSFFHNNNFSKGIGNVAGFAQWMESIENAVFFQQDDIRDFGGLLFF